MHAYIPYPTHTLPYLTLPYTRIEQNRIEYITLQCIALHYIYCIDITLFLDRKSPFECGYIQRSGRPIALLETLQVCRIGLHGHTVFG